MKGVKEEKADEYLYTQMAKHRCNRQHGMTGPLIAVILLRVGKGWSSLSAGATITLMEWKGEVPGNDIW